MTVVEPETRPIDRALVKSVIEKDQLIHGQLVAHFRDARWNAETESFEHVIVCESPAHCAVGALGFHAGFTNEELEDMPSTPSEMQDAELSRFYRTYGLNTTALTELLNVNDAVTFGSCMAGDDDETEEQLMARRKVAVLAAVDRLVDGPFEPQEFDMFEFADEGVD